VQKQNKSEEALANELAIKVLEEEVAEQKAIVESLQSVVKELQVAVALLQAP
jgi:hypothetical protein